MNRRRRATEACNRKTRLRKCGGILLILLASLHLSAITAEEMSVDGSGLNTRSDRVEPPSSASTPVQALAPGYCPSSGGSTSYESITGVTLTPNPGGSFLLVVQIYIANPTGCSAGSPCPEYDGSPEYVNVWIDWNGDNAWDASEKVMDKALTGYLAINYRGTMTAVTTVTPPAAATGDPTWLRANLGWSYDPNDPCEASWTWGNVFDKQVHFEAPQIKSITNKGVGTVGENPQTGKPVRLEADVEVPTGYELIACSWTGDLTNGIGDPGNNCRYEYTPATGPGPAVNTYGPKDVKLTVTYRHTASGATGQVSKDHTYKVFFKKTGDDDGDSIPNWFEYWGDDGAVAGLDGSGVKYDSTCPAGYICYGAWRHPPDDKVYVKDGAAGTHYASGITVTAVTGTCPGGTFGGAKGIDCAAEVLAHELRHKEIYHNWDSVSSTSCGSASGPWKGCTDSDTATTHARPGDDLPDDHESSLGTDANDVDSCDLAACKSPTYSQYGDNEFDAMQSSDGETGTASKDWANPGKQTTPSFAPLPVSHREAAAPLGTKSGSAGTHAPYGSISLPGMAAFGSLIGNYADIGMDTDGDGLNDWLQISLDVQISEAMTYYIVGWLEDALGTAIAWASTGQSLSAGSHTMALVFDGLVIRSAGIAGPYTLARVELRVVEDDGLVDAADDVHTTTAYLINDFDPPIARFTGSYNDIGVDDDTDGEYDILRISVGLDVEEAGTYTIVGELEGSPTIAVASTTTALSAGAHSVPLDFDGQLIFQRRENGPYYLRKLRIEDALGSQVDFVSDAYTTSAYTYDQFQQGPAAMNAASYVDQGLDSDSDGDFDYLRVSFELDVDHEGDYRLSVDLVDNDGVLISSRARELTLSVGANALNFDFPGGAISGHAVDGPYLVARVTLLDNAGALVDYQQEAHTTQAYSHASFSPPLVALAGVYEDSGRDADGDGLFNFLDIDISVTPGDAGVIAVQGRLVDGEGNEIEQLENYMSMVAGTPQVITLSFAGRLIRVNGHDGPFELRDLYVYHSGDPEQGVFSSSPHQTAVYGYDEFDLEDSAAVFRVTHPGDVYSDAVFYGAAFVTGAADIAEWVQVSESVEPGDVLELDPDRGNRYRKSSSACSPFVAGIVSTIPGFVLGAEEILDDQALLALIGIVPVKATNEGGTIQPGDLLVTSSTPGYAMRWMGAAPCPCSLVGKALGPMAEEHGVVLVLLTAH